MTQDATSDHYGMSVQVLGPRSFNTHGTEDSVNFFAFTEDTTYVTGDKLISDAARRTANYLSHGWACSRDGYMVR